MKTKLFSLLMIVMMSVNIMFGCGKESPQTPAQKPDPELPVPGGYQTHQISKKSGKDFKILQFADIQLDSNTNGGVAKTEENAYPLMRALIEANSPDLIVLSGDNVGGPDGGVLLDSLIKFMDGFMIPWTFLYGNHERDLKIGLDGIAKKLENVEYGIFDVGQFKGMTGYGNYAISVMDGKNTIYSLVMMDSGAEYSYFAPDQLEWYIDHIKKISTTQFGDYSPYESKVVKSMMFYHIPIDEFEDAAKVALNTDGSVKPEYGIGANKEIANGQGKNVGTFTLVKQMQSTTHMFVGHRHSNNSSITYEGVTMTFGNKAGKNNSHLKQMQGGTLITIKDKTNKVEVAQLHHEF